jgi:hypothetical protein
MTAAGCVMCERVGAARDLLIAERTVADVPEPLA